MSGPLTAIYGKQVTGLRSEVTSRLLSAWQALPDVYDTTIDEFVDFAVPLVRAGQEETAALTRAYVEMMASEAGMTASPTVTAAGEMMAVTDLRGIPAEEVYRRPALQVYTDLSQGTAYDEAKRRAAERLIKLAATDLQMTKVRVAQQAGADAGFKLWRRVLKGKDNCALCMLASTQPYSIKDLAPIHPGCDCDVAPWTGTGPYVDEDLLEQVHDAVIASGRKFDRSAKDYHNLVLTREHGEYGPTLTFKEDRFTGLRPRHKKKKKTTTT